MTGSVYIVTLPTDGEYHWGADGENPGWVWSGEITLDLRGVAAMKRCHLQAVDVTLLGGREHRVSANYDDLKRRWVAVQGKGGETVLTKAE